MWNYTYMILYMFYIYIYTHVYIYDNFLLLFCFIQLQLKSIMLWAYIVTTVSLKSETAYSTALTLDKYLLMNK